MKIANFSRTAFFIEHLRWLLLDLNHTTLNLNFTSMQGIHFNVVACKTFHGSTPPDILAPCEKDLEYSIDSSNFHVRDKLLLIRNDFVFYLRDLAVFMTQGVLFAQDLSIGNAEDFYLYFRVTLLHSVPYLFQLS